MVKFSLGFSDNKKPTSNPPLTGVQAPGNAPAHQFNQPNIDPKAAQILQNYQAALQHFNQLIAAGYDKQIIQNQWQQYYTQLSPAEKEIISQAITTPPPTPPPPAAINHQPDTPNVPSQPPLTGNPSNSDRKRIKPISEQVDYDDYDEGADINPEEVNNKYSSFFGTSVSAKKYDQWISVKNPKTTPPPNPPNNNPVNPNPPNTPLSNNLQQRPLPLNSPPPP